VFSKSRGTLFVVGDEGDICELRTDGTLVNKARIRKKDLEGITRNPVTGSLYALDELSTSILEIDPDNLEVLQRNPVALLPKQHKHEEKTAGLKRLPFCRTQGNR